MDFQLADAIASFLTVAVERDMNKKFHKKACKIFEMLGCPSHSQTTAIAFGLS